jgi:hypothetical protein
MLVRTTSGGKLAVHNDVGYCVGGVILTIVSLLSLAAHQVKKMEVLESRDPMVSAYNLDGDLTAAKE